MWLLALVLGGAAGILLAEVLAGIIESIEYKKTCKKMNRQWDDAVQNGWSKSKHPLVDPVLYCRATGRTLPHQYLITSPHY